MRRVRSYARSCLAGAALSVAAVALVIGCQAAPPGPAVTPPVGSVVVVADLLKFEPVSMPAPAGEDFVIFFDNREAYPHNVRVLDGSGTTLVASGVFTGPTTQLIQMPAVEPGTYKLLCDVHPDMSGSMTAAAE